MGLILGVVMAAAAWFRVWIFSMGSVNATAIALSCFAIVTTSVVAGTILPFALQLVGLDPAHAGASVQVFMDVMGCAVSCAICSAVLAVVDTAAPASLSAPDQNTVVAENTQL